MQHGWLATTASGRTIEHIPCPNPGGRVNEQSPAMGVLHTIEGGLDSGLGVFRQHFAPHFTLDGERIIQLVPLGTMAAALQNHPGGVETNSITRAQIELAGSSQKDPWICDDASLDLLADLLATLADAAEIPLSRPFPDAMPALPWATEDFARRKADKFGVVAGWFGHVEVPENDHWDPGAFEWAKLLARAEQITSPERALANAQASTDAPPSPIPPWYWEWLQWFLGEGDFKTFGPRNAQHRPADAPAKIPNWAWVKTGQFVAARKRPH